MYLLAIFQFMVHTNGLKEGYVFHIYQGSLKQLRGDYVPVH